MITVHFTLVNPAPFQRPHLNFSFNATHRVFGKVRGQLLSKRRLKRMIRFTAKEVNKVLAESTTQGRFKTQKERDTLRKAGGLLRKYGTREGASASAFMLKKRIGKALVASGAVSKYKFNKIFRRNLKAKVAGASGTQDEELRAAEKTRIEAKKEEKEAEKENKRVKFRKMYGKRIAIDERKKAYYAEIESGKKQASEQKKSSSSSRFNTPEAEEAVDTVYFD